MRPITGGLTSRRSLVWGIPCLLPKPTRPQDSESPPRDKISQKGSGVRGQRRTSLLFADPGPLFFRARIQPRFGRGVEAGGGRGRGGAGVQADVDALRLGQVDAFVGQV